MSLRCASKFNSTRNTITFEQMVRICTTGAIAKLTIDKSRVLLKCLERLVSGEDKVEYTNERNERNERGNNSSNVTQ